jgi:transposase InsO family protein
LGVNRSGKLTDRDPLFCDAFRDTLAAAGVQTVRLPARSPNLNAYVERFVRTIKESCLNRLILVGERALRHAVGEFVTLWSANISSVR